MISRGELNSFAASLNLGFDIVEKDYVLGWVLAGINQDTELKDKWAFKGGTCLKKCFFETYRFSEDLDFTLIDEKHLDIDFLITRFTQISEWVYESSGIELPVEDFNFKLYDNSRGNPSVQGKIGYNGPSNRRANFPRIKLDLTADELLVTTPIISKVHHPYSDFNEKYFNIKSYSYLEIFAEKLRALSERGRPRDLYDVVHLYRKQESRPDAKKVLEVLSKKSAFKNTELLSINFLKGESQIAELTNDWNSMLSHQLGVLPSLDYFLGQLDEVFEWLFEKGN